MCMFKIKSTTQNQGIPKNKTPNFCRFTAQRSQILFQITEIIAIELLTLAKFKYNWRNYVFIGEITPLFLMFLLYSPCLSPI